MKRLLVVAGLATLVTGCGGRAASTPDPTERPTPVPTATPWRLSVTGTTYTRKVGLGGEITVSIEIANKGTGRNPSTVVNFSELDKYADLFECKPACTVEDLPGAGPSAILPGVAAGKTGTFEIVFVASKVGAVKWSTCVYADEIFGDEVWCGDGTTAIK